MATGLIRGVHFISSDEEHPVVTEQPKKRRRMGTARDVARDNRAKSHATGQNCGCKRQCMLILTPDETEYLLNTFNDLSNRNAQDAHLSSLIRLLPITARRPRQTSNVHRPNSSSFKSYAELIIIIRRVDGDSVVENIVCFKAFIALHGVTRSRVETVKKSLTTTGEIHVDMRGKHKNRKHRLPDDDIQSVHEHIKSFRSRRAHYSRRNERKRVYLSEELNITKMFALYKEKYPTSRVKYSVYNKIFNSSFNISFGYPRCDTCSSCDEHFVLLKAANCEINECDVTDESKMKELKNKKRELVMKHDLHKRQAETFYIRKRDARTNSKTDMTSMAIAMDYSKNLPTPNISTNDVYYKRQLSFYSFNIHVLGTQASYFYTYDESVAKKGADDVTSILDDFIEKHVGDGVKHLHIFCDSCAGQNKNYTVLRYLHHLVITRKRFDSIKITFPVRGHSFLECDKNMGLINQKKTVETPDEWREHIAHSRVNPMPFVVVNCLSDMFMQHTKYLTPFYKRVCPFATRPIREFQVTTEDKNVMLIRNSYNSHWERMVVVQRQTTAGRARINTLQRSYLNILPLKKAKFNDLQSLAKFCSPATALYFSNFPFVGLGPDNVNIDSDASTDVAEEQDE